MSAHQALAKVLASAYQHKTSLVAHAAFKKHAADAEFLAHAQSEHDRLAGLEASIGCPLEQRCYASAQHLKFLRDALARQAAEQESEMSKLKDLAGFAREIKANVEKQAEDALTDMLDAKSKAETGISKLKVITGEIKDSARELEDFANQASNFPPDEK